jgi:hypothetical protein
VTTPSTTKLAYFHYRSFGDLVINLYCRKLFNTGPSVDFVPHYLVELYKLINNTSTELVLLDKIKGPPAFVNIRRSGPIKVMKSLSQMRAIFSELTSDYPEYHIFQDYKRWHQDLYFGASTHAPVRLDNVYRSHIGFYKNLNLSPIIPPRYDCKSDGIVRIFPFSSLTNKNINKKTLSVITGYLELHGMDYQTIYLEGENVYDFKHNYSIIPKKFSDLITTLKKSHFNISCDSLPAHLSSFYGIKTLVLILEKNRYWLPLNSFIYNNYITLESLEHGQYSKIFELIEQNYLYKNIKKNSSGPDRLLKENAK